MPRSSSRVTSCAECERLEGEFLEARFRLQTLRRLRSLTPIEEKRLIDRVALAIVRIKEHERTHSGEHERQREQEKREAKHNRETCEKGMADG